MGVKELYNVAIIGAGQLGSRHLQAILRSEYEINIFIIDPSADALKVAETRAEEISCSGKQLTFSKNYSVLPEHITLAVIATNSIHRLDALQNLSNATNIDYLILEKVLFQNENDFYLAEEIISAKSIKCYVNCPRRMFNFYNNLRHDLSDSDEIELIYSGGAWGLACNAVHLLDLFSFLSGRAADKIDCSLLENYTESKRKGYYEVYGIISGSVSAKNRIILKSDLTDRNSTMIINSKSMSVYINESMRTAYTATKDNNWIYTEENIDILYQSEMTNLVLKSLIETKKCNLTTYSESKNIHLPLLSSLTEYFKQKGIDGCPIT